jgi:CheY-like chemotaxis protein
MKIQHALVVDDSKSARFSLKKLLEQKGLRIDFAESAEAALSYLESNLPDVIFMDHFMPGMDGFEATQAIKSNPSTRNIPVVMCTSKDGPEYLEEARTIGAMAVLPKPTPADALTALFETIASMPEPVAGIPEDRVSDTAVAAQAADEQAQQAMDNLVNMMVEEQLASIRASLDAAIKEKVQAHVDALMPTLKASLNRDISTGIQSYVDTEIGTQAAARAAEVFDSRATALRSTLTESMNSRLNNLQADIQSAKAPSAELLEVVNSIVGNMTENRMRKLGDDLKQLRNDLDRIPSPEVAVSDLAALKDEMNAEINSRQPSLGMVKLLAFAGVALGAAALALVLM